MAISELKLDLLVEAEDLILYLGHPQLRILDLTRASVYEQLHIPHAIHVQPKQLVKQHQLASGLLPDPEKLQQFIQDLGLSPEHHVVAYDDEGGAWASRLLWNLHCIGFHKTSLLNGGIHAWLASGLPTSTKKEQIEPLSHFFSVPDKISSPYQIHYSEMLQAIENNKIQVWDCRTFDEYTGARLAARRGGHIPNALNYEWSSALNRENHLKLHELEYIQHSLQQTGFDLTQPVVVYCQSHHRSGLAYMVGRLLNWNIRAYDGAWSEWGNMPSSPIVTGEKPL